MIIEWLPILIYIQKGPGSNIGLDIGYHDVIFSDLQIPE
jgi:hypothetical protein